MDEPPEESEPPLEALATGSNSQHTTSTALAGELRPYLLKSSSTLVFGNNTVGVYLNKCCSVIAWFTTLTLFVVANFTLPIVCGLQIVLLDFVLARKGVGSAAFVFVWAPAFFELCLLAHLVIHRAQLYAVGSGSTQWIVYSWLIATKSCALYFSVPLELDTTSPEEPVNPSTAELLLDARGIVTILWLTPVFYMILTMRTLRELFQADSMQQPEAGGRQHHRAEHDRQEHATLDVVLLTDMVWHVVIDMIDIFYMMFMANPYDEDDSMVDTAFLKEHPEIVRNVKALVGGFVFLGLFFHQQSFPSISFTGTSGSQSLPRRLGKRKSSRKLQQAQPSQQLDYRVDVIKARKRSAIVSILMVDLPFLVIRTYMYILAEAPVGESHETQTTTPHPQGLLSSVAAAAAPLSDWLGSDWLGKPQLDKWWVKNALCLLLQAMQLRFVQQADLERSQTLRWWDVRRSVSDAASHGARVRRSGQDRNLQRKWEELEKDKLQAALEEDTNGQESSEHFGGRALPLEEAGQSPASVTEHPEVGSLEHDPPQASPESPVRQSSPRRRKGKKRCCGSCCCNCSCGVVSHLVMGVALGWLIAKVDFKQAVTDLSRPWVLVQG